MEALQADLQDRHPRGHNPRLCTIRPDWLSSSVRDATRSAQEPAMVHIERTAFTLIELLVVIAGNAMRSFCINRHNGLVNGVFIDVSGRPIGLKELWEVLWHRQWLRDRVNARTPVWPEWMNNFKDYVSR